MAREFFDEQLLRLDTELLKMGALVERALVSALDALEAQDASLATQVIDSDDEIDHKEREIETLCLDLLLRQQPVARDLRRIIAVLKMITDMERIGDQASDICHIMLDGAWTPSSLKYVHGLIPLGTAARSQVGAAIDAFVAHDSDKAQEVIAADAKVNRLFDAVKAELFSWMRQTDEDQSAAIDLLLIAKYLERVGDHAQNIAEWVEYSITGMHKGVLIT
jgi:phosphate transport system protein